MTTAQVKRLIAQYRTDVILRAIRADRFAKLVDAGRSAAYRGVDPALIVPAVMDAADDVMETA